GGSIPQHAFEVEFGNSGDSVGMSMLFLFENYAGQMLDPGNAGKYVPMKPGKLNHFEVLVSQQQIEIRVSPFSDDGKSFDPPQSLYTANVSLPFSRGYVHLTTHNHATLKYTGPGKGFGVDTPTDAVVARFDNVGFDGPVITNWREYEVPDSLNKFQAA